MEPAVSYTPPMATRAATEGARQRDGDKRRHRPGRPTVLTRVAWVPDLDEPTDVAHAVIAMVSDGASIPDAAAAAGLHHSSIYKAQGEGQAVLALIHEGKLDPAELTDYQAVCVEFSEGLRAAQARATTERLRLLGDLARGGHVRVKRRSVTDPNGNMTLTVEEEVLPPDRQAITTWLERRRPDLFGPVERREHVLLPDTAGQVGPASPRERLVDALEQITRRKVGQAELLAAMDMGDVIDVDEADEHGEAAAG